jgi:hypothetical protein
VDKEVAKKASRLAAILQQKKGRFVPVGEAVELALDKCLKEVA